MAVRGNATDSESGLEWEIYGNLTLLSLLLFFSFCRVARSKQTKAHISHLTDGRTDSTWD
jgi:hypothetical protein